MKRKMHPNSLLNLKPPQRKGDRGLYPKGRPAAGATIIEWMNVMQGIGETRLREIARNKRLPACKRAAAIQWLRIVRMPDVADFTPFIHGNKTMAELRSDGTDTTVVKRFGVIPGRFGDAHSLELHDHTGDALDRILDRTLHKPLQKMDTNISGNVGISADDVLRAATQTDSGRKAAMLSAQAMLEATGKKMEPPDKPSTGNP
jgi:hypothetical protein